MLTDALEKPFMTIANARVKSAIKLKKITLDENGLDMVSGLTPDKLSLSYAVDTCQRFAKLFQLLPLNMTEALARQDSIKKFLSVASPDGETIPQVTIDMIASLPQNFSFLPPADPNNPRDVLDKSILEYLDRYLCQQLRDCVYYRDEDDPNDIHDQDIDEDLALPTPTNCMMVSLPYDMTREEIVLTLEKIRDSRREA